MNYYSQNGQDKYLDQHVFDKKESGWYLDIGAHDGISFSNTYFFEKQRHWKGVCIEANPIVFQDLIKNRNSNNIHCALRPSAGLNPFIYVEPPLEMLSGLEQFITDAQRARIEKESSRFGVGFRTIEVPGKTFNEIKQESLPAKLDYCSIDIEGGELDLLDMIGIGEIGAEVFSVENARQNGYKRQLLLRQKFRQAGYTLIERLGSDDLFRLHGKRKWYKMYLDWRP
ncbi:MAG: FkbM family methyltransferase [Saprospiraceae bacterium]